MKVPVPPPAPVADLLADMGGPACWAQLATQSSQVLDADYHPWDWFRHHQPPEGLSHTQWWALVRSRRAQSARSLPLRLADGTPLTYNLPDPLLRLIDQISAQARGNVPLPEPVVNESTRDRYLVRSLIEEAITSSQLEGASTSRVRAKQMLREDRSPRDRSERMILNNFLVMQHILDLKAERLTPELVREIHRRVTEGTLDNPQDAGRLQVPGEERVRVYGGHTDEQVLHVPPKALELPERLQRLCDFANGDDQDGASARYVPALVRAITLHFMMGYDHYFVDGNGRSARAVFYWSMLHQGFFLTEFLSISRLLRKAPAQYARSFLLTERDEGDLTHFLLAQAQVVSRAIEELEAYLERKISQLRQATFLLRGLGLNHRQVAVIEAFLRDPGASLAVEAHRKSFGVVAQTARTDLQDLEARGLATSVRQGRKVVWFPAPDLAERVGA